MFEAYSRKRLARAVRLLMLAIGCSFLPGCGGGGTGGPRVDPSPSPTPTPRGDPFIAAAGDISCGTGTSATCKQMETSDLILRLGPDLVLPLGDNQYENGEYVDYITFYQPSWGRFLGITKPVPGNHEYQTAAAKGYFDYFNGVGIESGVAGERGKGVQSFDLGNWHLVGLNSNCADVKGCGAGSAQDVWLRVDLTNNKKPCTLAYWHHPRFTSGRNGNDTDVAPFWQALYENDADVILNGHDHNYQRFAPQTPAGVPDPARGIREFVVGTGGRDVTAFVSNQANTEKSDDKTLGVLKLTLHPTSYEWEFVPLPGATFRDFGSGNCH